MTLGFGDYAQAKFDFQGESPSDLSLSVGDVVKITDTIDKNWLVGEKVGHENPPRSGSFPGAFVEQLVLPSVRTGQKIFLAVEDFMAEQTGDLELAKGDVITGMEAVDESWWRGKNGPLKGIFPLSFVVELWHDDGLRSRSYSARAGSLKSRSGSLAGSRTSSFGGYSGLDGVGEASMDPGITKVTEPTFARALVDVSPQLDGELAFQLGDLIEITEIIDTDWFFGRSHQKEGLVSAVCVELLEDLDGGEEGGSADRVGVDAGGSLTYSEHGDLAKKTSPALPVPPQPRDVQSLGEEYRLRNSSSGSYTSENTRSHDAEIIPYAQVLYPFTGQGWSELSLQEGQIVTLIRHVDADWTEGELDGKKGLFPTSFVDVVVDCAPYVDTSSVNPPEDHSGVIKDPSIDASNTAQGYAEDALTSSERHEHDQSQGSHSGSRFTSSVHVEDGDSVAGQGVEQLPSDPGVSAGITEVLEICDGSEIGLVLHTFNAQVEGDVSVREGDTVEVVRHVDDNWLEIRTDGKLTGLVPRNHIEIIGLWTKEEPSTVRTDTSNGHATQPDASGLSISQGVLERETDAQCQRNSGSDYSISSSHSGLTQKSHNSFSERSLTPKSHENQKAMYETPKSTKPVLSKALSLPSPKPNLPPKPVLPPKPTVKPKPSPGAKSPLERSHTLNPSKPARPPPLMTAKPFSSLPRAKPHHVVSPNERRLSLSSLDSIIEGEMEKAKSRSSSQASDSASEKYTSAVDAVAVSSDTSISVESSSKMSHEKKQSLPPQVESSNSLGLGAAKEESTTKSSKDHLCFEDNFTGITSVSVAQNLSVAANTCSSAIPSGRPTLLTSQSVSENKQSGDNQDSSQRRKSASFAERTNIKPGFSGAASQRSQIQSAFVNKAFEMEVDEGKLVDVGGDHRHNVPAMPKRPPPSRPSSAVLTSSSSLSSKAKAPPPRPTGPRIAPAPSKVPLVPARVAPTPPASKLVPKRAAPRAPGLAPPTNLITTTKSNGKSLDVAKSEASQPPAAPLARPAPQPPVRQPPRPASLATPPHRAPPPRPADLIAFSPDEPNNNMDEDSGISEDTKREMVKDLKTKLEENKADIKKYEESRLELQARLAEASEDSAHTAEARDNLQFVESTLAGLQEEGRGLKENLFSLDPHEGRLEKARLLAAQHAAEEEKRKEEERLAELDRRRKRKEHRANVLDEILDTEKDYLFSMHLCLETFVEGPKPPPGVELEFLLGNMEEIADVSQKVLLQLESSVLGKSTDDQCVGRCFSSHAEDMKNTYAPYCRNHDDVITVLEKLADPSTPPVITDYINGRLDKMREQMNVFDLAGVLIKPVQRILKYPLLLNELLKNTESDHPDKLEIVDAIKAMTDVAKAINEYKRRKDLVYKYKKSTDQTFGDKISKLTLHSIKKKSSRMKGRLSTNLGIGLHTRDEAFEREEIKFRNLEKAVKIFHRSVIQYLNDSQEQMRCRELFIEDIVEFYLAQPCIEVQKLQEVMAALVDLFVNMKETIENVVVIPLNTLVSLFNAPTHVIEKRFDKLLDYNNQLGKTENDKELQSAKNDYEAMNAQLLDELPKFYNLAFGMLRNCVSAYVLARRDFMDQSLKESCCLLELPSIANKANVMEVFGIRHTTSYDHVSLLSFIPRGFNPRVDTIKADKARLKGKTGPGDATLATNSAEKQTIPGSQSDSQRAYLRSTYAASKLFKVTKSHVAADLMDISLTEGMLVGVVKELDPMGNKERWFLDDGLSKGFAPSTGLTPASLSPANSVNNLAGGGGVDDDILSVHSYDSGENVVISGNDGRAAFTPGAGTTSLEASPQRPEEEQPKQYHYALYDFAARQPNEASLQAGHPVNVVAFQDIDGNSEWWLVEGADGQRGYAPANYMAPMPYS